MNKRKIINDPVYGFISLPSDLIFDLLEHPFLQRLSRIRQLGLTYLVYPGAQHSRLQHALGAMHLMQQALEVLKQKGAKVSDDEAEAACAAVLLHDIGHGPFSHTLEELILTDVSHETLTGIMMEKLNAQFAGQLDLTLKIFTGRYHKKFLHELVSSQLDMDRLDYLTRDSFFTGVTEGVIGYDRIIKMLSVYNNELVVEEKGIYSIEKFLVSRRFMYWQVYLHKTVLAAEEMLTRILMRARMIHSSRPLPCSPALSWFLSKEVNEYDARKMEEVIKRFAELDDADIIQAIKQWRADPDFVLSFLCDHLISRKLFKIELQPEAFLPGRLVELRNQMRRFGNLSEVDYPFLIITDSTSNHAYNPTSESIRILFKNGKTEDIAVASDLMRIAALKEPTTKYYLCYPRELT